ncbi:MAG: hypothetical protein ABSH20_24130 [Tepidisphaeraceae bacterium]
MPQQEQTPKLKITFAGEGFRHGAVPLTVVAAKLQALQQAMFHAAAAAAGHSGERRGLWFNRYRGSAELTFASAKPGSLVIEAELAADPVLSDDFNLGLKAVDQLFEVAVAIGQGKLGSIALAPQDRDYLIRSITPLMPNSGDQYSVQIENCRPDKHPSVTFTAASRELVKDYVAATDDTYTADEVTIVGELIKIYVDAGEDKITVRSQQRNIDCFYGDTLRDQVANLIAGSTVEVTGHATLGERDQVDRIHRMLSVEHVSMEPIRIARFEHAGHQYDLTSPVAVNIEYADGLWVYHHPVLNLWGYAARREDALANLHADFAYIYREIAEENTENLDGVAQQLRLKLLTIVVPKPGENHHA